MNKLISIRMPKKLLSDMDVLVKSQGYTHQELIRESVREFILRKKQKMFWSLAGSKNGKHVSKEELDLLAKKVYS